MQIALARTEHEQEGEARSYTKKSTIYCAHYDLMHVSVLVKPGAIGDYCERRELCNKNVYEKNYQDKE